ncbi:MAG: hypothetical protein NT030_06200, partial [Candidatus Saganbacteria bacterium]|nr:hypothetical protein [Candidatus Saganbacteria bacterium]
LGPRCSSPVVVIGHSIGATVGLAAKSYSFSAFNMFASYYILYYTLSSSYMETGEFSSTIGEFSKYNKNIFLRFSPPETYPNYGTMAHEIAHFLIWKKLITRPKNEEEAAYSVDSLRNMEINALAYGSRHSLMQLPCQHFPEIHFINRGEMLAIKERQITENEYYNNGELQIIFNNAWRYLREYFRF